MKPKGRPKKRRLVKDDPKIIQFSPRGRPGRPDEAELAMEEFEAIRLADCLGLDQKKAARAMHISQQTFSRILKKAHKSMADALVNGKILKIRGGHYLISAHQKVIDKTFDKDPQAKQEQKEFGFI
ncbi:MAG: DUF134 domain-containing protein [Candidatus Omnitrophica bacterium]|nr:DUF134 domain-containing protein [Candidatus Omnitrophota bacterium]